MNKLLSIAFMLTVCACATQRYGRQTDLSEFETKEFSCRDIRLETAKNDQFLSSLHKQRSELHGADILGFLGDFGIGNVMEGNAAKESGRVRMKELKQLASQKGCQSAASGN